MIRRNYRFSGGEGFHARPVSEFVKITKTFSSAVTIEFENEIYDGKSTLSIMCGCIEDGCSFSVCFCGSDEEQAAATIESAMVRTNGYFVPVECMEGQPPQAAETVCRHENRYLVLSDGIAVGNAVIFRHAHRSATQQACVDPQAEYARFQAAVEYIRRQLELERSEYEGTQAAGILDAHLEILHDKHLSGEIGHRIQTGMSCEMAVQMVSDSLEAQFLELKNLRMQERAADIRDVAGRLLEALTGATDRPRLTEETCIIVADELLPSDTISLDLKRVVGLITERGGVNSHSAIVARSMGIPALSNVSGVTEKIGEGECLILDCEKGMYIANPSQAEVAHFLEKAAQYRRLPEQDDMCVQVTTPEGYPVELSVNILSAGEMEYAISHGAEGVGLFRTEFIYMNRTQPPGLQEQTEIYETLLRNAAGRPVTIRTLDAGGDKPTPCLPMQPEKNPFLGMRAIRFCLAHEDVFRTQLRALLLASRAGKLRIMFPMLATVEETAAAFRLLHEEKTALEKQDVQTGMCQAGIMIETPAAALMAPELAKLADFFCIGTNDLTQYTMAADRELAALKDLHSPYQPAVLRLIAMAAAAAQKAGIWTGICGESGGNPLLAPLYLAMGITEFSMAVRQLADVRSSLLHCGRSALDALLQRVLGCATAEEVEKQLNDFARKRGE